MSSSDLRVRTILDIARPGIENMQIDAGMLDRAVAGEVTVRTYQWSRPTVSLGHFQKLDDAVIPENLTNLDIVQRLSGGGAILHHHELTYSFAIPKWHARSETPLSLYELAHSDIIEILNHWGITAQMRGDAAFRDESFLCFRRGDARDIVIGPHKIVGSAQRRRQGAILQHGSILLQRSEYLPEIAGIFELSGVRIDPSQLAEQLLTKLSVSLGRD